MLSLPFGTWQNAEVKKGMSYAVKEDFGRLGLVKWKLKIFLGKMLGW